MPLLEKLKVRVVGLQYYGGTINKDDHVIVTREPTNIHDKNAIRVSDTKGVRVGYVNRNAAAVLAPLMDENPPNRIGRLSFDVVVPVAVEDRLSIHVELFIQGDEQWKQGLTDYMEEHLGDLTPYELYVMKQSVVALTKKQTEKELNKMFDLFDSPDVSIQEEANKLKQVPGLLTVLLDHQKYGVTWMKKREEKSPTALPTFWRRREEEGDYINELTSTISTTFPVPVLGGLLLDAMGLGKSIQMLSLCLLRPRPPRRNDDKTSGGTLIICPASVISAWESQIEEHVEEGTWDVHLHYGPKDERSEVKLYKPDIVLTTFDIVSRESKNRRIRGLKRIKWHRIIVDEAHMARNKETLRFKSLVELNATHRWALTGTPLVNDQNDIYALMAFLRLTPFNDYSVWTKTISKPIKNGDEQGLARLRVALKETSLRREKSVLTLPPRTIEVRLLEFLSNEHRDCYKTLHGAAVRVLGSNAEVMLKNYVTVLEVILRLRQACCDPSMIPVERLEAAKQILRSTESELKREGVRTLLNELKVDSSEYQEDINEEEDYVGECVVCSERVDIDSARILDGCSHVLCDICLGTVTDKRCPLCFTPFVEAREFSEVNQEEEEEEDATTATAPPVHQQQLASKVKAVVDYMESLPLDEKCVIFSNFTQFLSIVEEALEKKYQCVLIDGSVSINERKERVKQFQTDDETRVFLISMKAGGVGITLTRANHVIVLDPWWNYSTEDQAYERVHRIGQKKPCYVRRFIMKDTIEERILDIQQKKKDLSSGALRKLSGEEMRRMKTLELQKLLDL